MGLGLADRRVDASSRRDLIQKLEETQEVRREWIRRQVIDNERIDLLCTEVLGYEIRPHHLRMLQHQHSKRTGNLCLVWRGAGKTTTRTIARCLFLLLQNPDTRILIASKSSTNSVTMLSEIKRHFESDRFKEVFGDWRGPKWDDTEIIVAPRTSPAKESSISCVGVESAVVSRHYDVIIGDDLVDEENARTAYMRNKLLTWYYKTLIPTLEPGGELSIHGTRYHHLDLYGHLIANEMSGGLLRMPALVGNDVDGWRSQWPEKFSTDHLLRMRSSMGSIIFDSQYQVSTEKMAGGGIFDIDQCQLVSDDQIPDGLPRFLGADLAISQKTQADLFEVVVVAYDSTADRYYVIDHYANRNTFQEQRRIIEEMSRRHDIERGAIEAIAYQAALIQELKRENPDLSLIPVKPKKDKVTRAWRLAAKFEDRKMFFRKGLDGLIEELVLFPDAEHDDGFDALDLAVKACRMRAKKARREPGLL